MARIDSLANFLTDIAAAIKTKTGKTDPITPANFDTEIASIESGGNDSSVETKLLPEGYTRLLCLESTGSQYIITDLMVTEDTNFYTTFRTFSGFTSSSFACIFGTRYTYNDNGYSLTTYPGSTEPSNTGHFLLDGTRYSAGMTPGTGLQTIRFKDGVLYNESGAIAHPSVQASPPDPMAIFGVQDTLGKGVTDRAGNTVLYTLTFDVDGEIVADYIPAMRDSDNEVGLYDTVSGKFFTNAGTGSFKYEPMPTIRLQNKSVEITENGTQNVVADTGYDGLHSVDITSNIKYAPKHISFYSYMGNDLSYEVQNIDSSNITMLSYAFQDCRYITSLDLTGWNTSNATVGMYRMFFNCVKLERLILNGFDTSKVKDMDAMFSGCTSLKYLDIRTFDFSSATSYSTIFAGVPASCEIIVKDNTVKEWVLARRSDFTNVKTVAELEAEV